MYIYGKVGCHGQQQGKVRMAFIYFRQTGVANYKYIVELGGLFKATSSFT